MEPEDMIRAAILAVVAAFVVYLGIECLREWAASQPQYALPAYEDCIKKACCCIRKAC